MAVDAGKALAYLELDTSKFESGLKSAMSDLKTFMDSSQSASDRVGALGTAFTTVGGTLTKNVTTPIVAVGTATVAMASSFEKSMSNVKAISQATDTQFQDLKDTALSLGASTAFSAGEVADAMTEMAKAGWTSQQIIEGMSGVLDAAAASGEGLAAVSTIVADAITGFGMEAADSSRVADLLTQAANSGTIGINDLGESFKYIAPIAKSLNINIEDTVTAISAMSLAGIKGSQAGTSLRTMLTRMVKPTKMVQEAMEQLGFSAKNADGTFKELPDILSELRVKFADLTDAQKAQYAAQLAGQEGMSGLLSILNLTQEEYDEIAKTMYESNGVAQQTAEVMQDNLASSMEQLGGAIETLSIKIGTALLPTVRKITEFITSVVEKITQLDDAVIEQIVKIAAVVAAIGPLLLIIGQVITGVSKLMPIISMLASPIKLVSTAITGVKTAVLLLANPIVLITAAIAALIAIFVNLYQTNEEFRNEMNQIWEGIKETVVGAIEVIKQIGMTLWEGIKPSLEMLMETFDGIKEQLAGSLLNAFNAIKNVMQEWQPIIEKVGEILGAVFLTILAVAIGTVNGLIEALAPLIDVVTGIINVVAELGTLITAVFNGDMELVKQSLSNIWNEIVGIFENAFVAIEEFLGGFSEGFIKAMDDLFAAFGVEGVGAALTQFKDDTIAWIEGMVEAITGFFTNIWETLVGWYDGIVAWFEEQKALLDEGFAYWLGTMLGRIAQWVLDTVAKLSEWIISVKEKAKEAMLGLFNTVVEYLSQIPGKFKEWLDKVIDKITGFNKDMEASGKGLFESLWDGLKSVWEDIWSWISGIGEKISSAISGFSSGFSQAFSGSHANGLDYVPYNGYVAQLHQGERVLTKEQNEEYNEGRANGSGGDTYIFYSDKQIDEYEAARQMRLAKKEMELDFV